MGWEKRDPLGRRGGWGWGWSGEKKAATAAFCRRKASSEADGASSWPASFSLAASSSPSTWSPRRTSTCIWPWWRTVQPSPTISICSCRSRAARSLYSPHSLLDHRSVGLDRTSTPTCCSCTDPVHTIYSKYLLFLITSFCVIGCKKHAKSGYLQCPWSIADIGKWVAPDWLGEVREQSEEAGSHHHNALLSW